MVNIGNDWDGILASEFSSPYYLELRAFLKEEYRTRRIYPGMYDIFNALKTTPFASVKCVILGQDPYHGAGQAHGLCFSVRPGVEPPPFGMPEPPTGDLTPWAKEGVLLLNTTLTVREGQPQSHKGHGWETLTDAIIRALNGADHPIVFLLWGSNARSKKALITNPRHLILEAAHPSPLSAYNGFFGCRHFSRANDFLKSHGVAPVNWAAIASENA